MKKTIVGVAAALILASTAHAGGFSWGVSIGIGQVCAPPVVYAPVVVSQPVVVQPVVVQQVVYTPAVVVQPVCTIPVVNYYRSDCYRSPVTGTIWVGGSQGGGHHRHHGRR